VYDEAILANGFLFLLVYGSIENEYLSIPVVA
jgi:hypothetical protein